MSLRDLGEGGADAFSESSRAEPEQPEARSVAGLRADLEELRTAGAAAFDAPGFGMIGRLLERAGELDAPASDRLLERSATRLDDLRRRTLAARRDAKAALERLVERGVEVEDSLREAFESGEWARLHRAERRARRLRPTTGQARRERRADYHMAVADFSAALGIAGVEDSPPVQAGPLNGSMLAARVLGAAQSISPAYRRHLVGELIDLGSLLELSAAAPPRMRS